MILKGLMAALASIITGGVIYAVQAVVRWLKAKINNTKIGEILSTIEMIITDSVQNLYQTVVEKLKADGNFTPEKQAEVKQAAIDMVMKEMAPELKTYISANFGNIREYVSEQIEAVIYKLKNQNKKA